MTADKAQLQRVQEMCDMVYRDMDQAMHDGEALGWSPHNQAIIMAKIAAAVSGLAVAVKLMAGGTAP